MEHEKSLDVAAQKKTRIKYYRMERLTALYAPTQDGDHYFGFIQSFSCVCMCVRLHERFCMYFYLSRDLKILGWPSGGFYGKALSPVNPILLPD